MSITSLPVPVLFIAVLFLAVLSMSLILITSYSSAAAQRLLRLLEALGHLIHGTCPSCGQAIKSSRKSSQRTRKG